MEEEISKADLEHPATRSDVIAVFILFWFILTFIAAIFIIIGCPDDISGLTSGDADVCNFTNGDEDIKNETLKLRLQDSFPNDTSIDGISNLTQKELSRQFTNNSGATNATFTESEQAFKEYTNYGMISSIASYMVAHFLQYKAKKLKELLLLHLSALYASQLFFYAVFRIFRTNNEDDESLMYSSASFAHFFLLALASWTSVMPSEDFKPLMNNVKWLKRKGGENNWRAMAICIMFPFSEFLSANILLLLISGFVINIIIGSRRNKSLPFCWTEVDTPPTFIISVLGFVATNLFSFLGCGLNEPRVGKHSNVFLSLSVMTYITWTVGALASYLSLSLLRRIFIITSFFEGLVFFFIYRKCNTFSDDDRDSMIIEEVISHVESSLCSQRNTNTVEIQAETTRNGKIEGTAERLPRF